MMMDMIEATYENIQYFSTHTTEWLAITYELS